MALQTPKLAHKPRSLVSGPFHSGPRAICQQCSRVRPAPRMLALTTWATSSTQVDTKAAPSKVTASALKADQVLLRMSVPFRVNFGEVIRVVGSAPEFGSWEVEAAPIFEWTEGDVWVASFAMSPGRHEFKVVVHTLATKSTRWETSANRLLEIPKGPGTLMASCYWGVSNVEYAFEPGRPDFSFLKNMVTYPGDPSARSSAKADSSSSGSSGSNGSSSSSSKAGSSGNGNGNGKSPSGHSDTSSKPLAAGQDSGRSANGQASSSPRSSSSGGGGRTAAAAKPSAAAAASPDMGSSDTPPKGLFASLKMTSALNSLKAAIGMEAGARSATPSPSRSPDPERHEPAPLDKPHSSAGGKGAAAKGESYPEDARYASRSSEPQQSYNGSSSKASINGTASTNGKASAGSSSNSSSSSKASSSSSSSGTSNHHADNGSPSSAKLMKEGLVGLDPDRIQQSVEAALKGKVAPPAAPSTPTPSRAPTPSTAAQTSSAGRSSKAHNDTALTNGKAHASNNGHHHHDWDEDEEGEEEEEEEEEGASAPLTKMPQLPKDLLVAKRPQVLPGAAAAPAAAAAAAAAAAKPGGGATRAAAARPPSGFKKVVTSSAVSEAKPADKPLAAKSPDSMGDKPTPQPVLKAVMARRVGTPVPALGSIRASLPEMKEMQRELGDWERSSPPAQPMWQLLPRFVRQPTPAPSRFPSPSPSRSLSRGKTPRPLRAAELLNPEMSKTLGLRNPPRVVQQQYHEIQRSMALEEAGFSQDEIARATGHRDAGMQRAGSGGSSIQAFSDVDEDGARPRLFWATAGAAALLATAGSLWMQPPQASKLQAAPSPVKASIPSSKTPASTTPAPALKAAPASTTASPAAASSSSPPPAATASAPTAAGSKAAPAAGLAATPAKQGPGGGEESGRSDKAGGGSTSTPAAAAKAAAPAPAPAPAATLPSPDTKPSNTASVSVDKKAGVTATAAASPAPAVASPSLTSKADSKADGKAVSKADGQAGSAEASSAGKLAAEKQGPGAAAAEKAASDSQAVSAMVSALLPTPSEPSLPQASATVAASRPAAATAVAAAAAVSPKLAGGQEGSQAAAAAGKAAGPGASATAEQAVEGKAGGAEGGAVKAVEVKAVEVKAAAEAKMQSTTQGQQGLSAAGREDHSPSQVAVSSQGGGSRAQGSSREAAGATAASSPASGDAAGSSPAGPSGPLLASEVAASGLDPGMVQSHEGVDSTHAQARNAAHVA